MLKLNRRYTSPSGKRYDVVSLTPSSATFVCVTTNKHFCLRLESESDTEKLEDKVYVACIREGCSPIKAEFITDRVKGEPND